MAFQTIKEMEEAGVVEKRNPTSKQKDKIQGLRAGMMAIDRAMGRSISEIAQEYHVTPQTVKSYLSSAEEEGFIDHFRRSMYDRLGGKVMAVYEAHLDQGSLVAAKDLAFGLGILTTGPAKTKEKAIETLDQWRKEREPKEIKDVEIVNESGN